MRLLSFVDNHDVTRVSSILKNKSHLPLVYGLLFGMPGIPCIYYGSEWGIEGMKQEGSDAPLRPSLDEPQWNDLTTLISKVANIYKENSVLQYGSYKSIVLTNRQLVFERLYQGERIWIGINADATDYTAYFNGPIKATNLLTGELIFAKNNYKMEPYSLFYWKISE
jgi:glycosidase